MRKNLLGAVLSLGLSLAMSQPAAAGQSPSAKSMAMQCYTLYEMMTEGKPDDQFGAQVLSGQAMLMATIYALQADRPDQPLTQEAFDAMSQMVRTGLITTSRSSREPIVDKLINCEGWREEVLMYLAARSAQLANSGDDKAAVRRTMQDIPAPKANYPLKGATELQLNVAVDEAFARYTR